MSKLALIVDDSPTMRNMVKATLENQDYTTHTAEDGEKAFTLAERTQYNLIITDINMPNIDGIELIRMIREDNDLNKFTPILVLTTESGSAAKAAGKNAGASGWIVKPFDPETLLNAASKVCQA